MSVETGKINERSPGIGQDPVICSIGSRTVDEQLFGTVSRTENWILLEYPYPFGAKAFEESLLAPEVKSYLASTLQAIPDSRLLLIRKRSPSLRTEIHLFAATAREREPALYEFQLSSYDQLLSLDFAAVFSGDEHYQEKLRRDPLWLVCTNGRRDPCCARWGLPVYEALANTVKDPVWQTSHVGGHRFAANVVCFPHGIYYGRIDPSEAESLISASHRQQIYLAKYRGRSVYPAQAQAAEYFLRRQTGLAHLDAFRLQAVQEVAPNRWGIQFLSATGEISHRLEILGEESEYQVYESCSSKEPTHQVQYRLIHYEAIPLEGAVNE